MKPQPHPLDTIILKTGKKRPDGDGIAAMAVLDDQVIKPGFFTRNYDWYAVRDNRKAAVVDQECTIGDFEHNRSCRIAYRYKAAVVPSNKEAAVLAISRSGRHISDYIAGAIRNYLDDWYAKNLSALAMSETINRRKSDIRAGLASMFLQIGLDVDVIINAESEVRRTWSFVTAQIAVRAKDHLASDLNLQLDVQIVPLTSVDVSNPESLVTENDWKRKVESLCKTCFENEISLWDYYYDRDTVETTLRTAINAGIREFGMQVGTRLVARTERPAFPQRDQIDVTLPWKGTTDRPVPFRVKAQVAIKTGQAGLYVSRGKPGFEDWLERRLDDGIKAILFGKDFTDLKADGIRQISRELEERLDRQAKAYGMTVRTLLVEPHLEEWDYCKKFSVNVPSAKFRTKDPNLSVDLDMTLMGHIPEDRLSSVKRFLWPENTLTYEMQNAAVAAAQGIVQNANPDDFFRRFEAPPRFDDNGVASYEPEDSKSTYLFQIQQAVARSLQETFSFNSQEVLVRINDSDLKKLGEKIRDCGQLQHTTKVRPRDRRTSARDVFTIETVVRFDDIAHDNVVALLKRGFDPEVTKADIRRWIDEWFQERTFKELDFGRGPKVLSNLRRNLRNDLASIVRGATGVYISLTGFKIVGSADEDEMFEISQDELDYDRGLRAHYKKIEELRQQDEINRLQKVMGARLVHIGERSDETGNEKQQRLDREAAAILDANRRQPEGISQRPGQSTGEASDDNENDDPYASS